MDINAAYREVGSCRCAAQLCGTTPKTVRRAGAGAEAGTNMATAHNYDAVAGIVAERVAKTKALILAKRLLPVARAAGYEDDCRPAAAWAQLRLGGFASTMGPPFRQ